MEKVVEVVEDALVHNGLEPVEKSVEVVDNFPYQRIISGFMKTGAASETPENRIAGGTQKKQGNTKSIALDGGADHVIN